jgi:hypothetical protein
MPILLLLLACIALDADGPAAACASSADCSGDLECSGPDDWAGCGIGPTEACAADDACGDGTRCHAVPDSCSADGIGSRCDAPCDPSGCGDGFTCDDGACRATSCVDDPSLCAAHQVCDPSSVTDTLPVYDQHHGCVNVTCTADGDCAAGLSCVNRFCQDGPGECVEVYAVP